MSFLLLYVGDGQEFQLPSLTSAIQTLKGVTPLLPSLGSRSSYEYEMGDDLTQIRVKNDLETVVIDGMGEASLSAAIHIQSNYPGDIHMIDEAYTFDISLRGIDSVGELERRFHDAGA